MSKGCKGGSTPGKIYMYARSCGEDAAAAWLVGYCEKIDTHECVCGVCDRELECLSSALNRNQNETKARRSGDLESPEAKGKCKQNGSGSVLLYRPIVCTMLSHCIHMPSLSQVLPSDAREIIPGCQTRFTTRPGHEPNTETPRW